MLFLFLDVELNAAFIAENQLVGPYFSFAAINKGRVLTDKNESKISARRHRHESRDWPRVVAQK